jgi:hypothetical protein
MQCAYGFHGSDLYFVFGGLTNVATRSAAANKHATVAR